MNIHKIVRFSLLLSLVAGVPSAAMNMKRIKSASNIYDLTRNNEKVPCNIDVEGFLTLKEQLHRQRKEEQVLHKKSALKWGLFGFLTHLSAGLGIKYVVNHCEKGGSFLKNFLKPVANSFITKPFLPLVYFSKYVAYEVGDMLPLVTSPTLNTFKKFFSGLMKEGRSEYRGVLRDTRGEANGFVNETLIQIDKSAEKLDDKLKKRFDESKDQVVNAIDAVMQKEVLVVKKTVGEIMVENTPRIGEIAENTGRRLWTGLFTRKNGKGKRIHENEKWQKIEKDIEVLEKKISETVNEDI